MCIQQCFDVFSDRDAEFLRCQGNNRQRLAKLFSCLITKRGTGVARGLRQRR